MTVKKPTSLSAAWWKANKPKSMPKSPVDTLIVECGTLSFSDKMKKVLEVTKTEDLSKANDVRELIGNHTKLMAELKRYQAIVMKEKHVDFANAINDLIAFAKKDRDAVLKALETTQSVLKAVETKKEAEAKADAKKAEGKDPGAPTTQEDERFGRTAQKILENYAAVDKKLSDEVLKHIARIAAETSKATKAEQFSKSFGENKFLQAWIKTKLGDTKKEREQLDKDIAKAGIDVNGATKKILASAAKGGLQFTLKAFDDMKTESKTLDKKILTLCVEKLGKKVASETYVGASQIKLTISVPKPEKSELAKFKKKP